MNFLLSFLLTKSFATSVGLNESVNCLCACNIAIELNRAANIFKRNHVFILCARENKHSPVAVVAGFTKSNLQIVTTFGISSLCGWSIFFIWLTTSWKQTIFSSLNMAQRTSFSTSKWLITTVAHNGNCKHTCILYKNMCMLYKHMCEQLQTYNLRHAY